MCVLILNKTERIPLTPGEELLSALEEVLGNVDGYIISVNGSHVRNLNRIIEYTDEIEAKKR